ncbi:hypothetical protein [uncultured Kocuria sp.]|uniref:hypothetical protein n=1 Tax=uncultured Kocuria sp. TaxID=259305 RepID=UPI00259AD838|nr:hypothetical protein [uncultured Kocuria sp.]MCT1368398.1 hypothetical protein [Rothia sp. p3-SID1597]
MTWGQPPSFFLGADGDWSDRDKIAAIGYQLAEDTKCPECGNPLAVCRDPGMAGRFTIRTDTCLVREAVESHQNEPGYRPSPGEIVYAVPGESDDDEETTSYGLPPWMQPNSE